MLKKYVSTMKRIIKEAERQVPISPRIKCANEKRRLLGKRQWKAEQILEQMRLLFESGYQGYVNKQS